jgi:hypothetical protein
LAASDTNTKVIGYDQSIALKTEGLMVPLDKLSDEMERGGGNMRSDGVKVRRLRQQACQNQGIVEERIQVDSERDV